MKKKCRLSFAKLEAKGSLARPEYRQDDNIKMYINEIKIKVSENHGYVMVTAQTIVTVTPGTMSGALGRSNTRFTV
jgi:multisubunit Na+/H+ antiporter MnhE subunit